MPKLSQSAVEQHYFEKFRNSFQLPSGTVAYGDKPDIIITGEMTIGIEITNFYLEEGANPASEQVQRKLRDAVLSMAQNIHHGNGGEGRGHIWLQ